MSTVKKNIYDILIDNQPIWATATMREGRPGNKNKGAELMTEYGTVVNFIYFGNIFAVSS